MRLLAAGQMLQRAKLHRAAAEDLHGGGLARVVDQRPQRVDAYACTGVFVACQGYLASLILMLPVLEMLDLSQHCGVKIWSEPCSTGVFSCLDLAREHKPVAR